MDLFPSIEGRLVNGLLPFLSSRGQQVIFPQPWYTPCFEFNRAEYPTT